MSTYAIKKDYIAPKTKRRFGTPVDGVRFIVAHDTGNMGSTAAQNVAYYKRTADEVYASAHIFVDDKEVIECIPAFEQPEKAWHVRYSAGMWHGHYANDAAIGVEYCYGTGIDAPKAYARYVWVLAKLCHQYGIQAGDIVGHYELDPTRRTDPQSGLQASGFSFAGLIEDVHKEIKKMRDTESADNNHHMIVYQIENKPEIYIAVGTKLVHIATDWETYKGEFGPAKIIELPQETAKEFFTIAETVSVQKK